MMNGPPVPTPGDVTGQMHCPKNMNMVPGRLRPPLLPGQTPRRRQRTIQRGGPVLGRTLTLG